MKDKITNLELDPGAQPVTGSDDTSSSPLKFGTFKIPSKFENQDLVVSCRKEDTKIIYDRSFGEDKKELVLLTTANNIVVHPIEPVNTPEHLTPYLLIEFSQEVMVEPKTNRRIYLKFPLEIGVFIYGEKGTELIDAVTFTKQKFTLYGDTRIGELCKYWKSDIYSKLPDTKTLHEGVIELTISNPTGKWIPIKQAVFNAYGMQLFFNEKLVSIKTVMKLQSEVVAETEVLPEPVITGMTRAIELYTAFRAPVLHKKFVMECGL
jgi:hypothetical protein